MQGRVRNLDVTPVGEETLSMRADVPVEGKYADKLRELFRVSGPEPLSNLGLLAVPVRREHFRSLSEGHGVHGDP